MRPFSPGSKVVKKLLAVGLLLALGSGVRAGPVYSVKLDGSLQEERVYSRPDVDVSGLVTV